MVKCVRCGVEMAKPAFTIKYTLRGKRKAEPPLHFCDKCKWVTPAEFLAYRLTGRFPAVPQEARNATTE